MNDQIDPPETVYTDKQEVWCEGSEGALGHPRVYLHMKDGRVECNYCDRLFIFKKGDD